MRRLLPLLLILLTACGDKSTQVASPPRVEDPASYVVATTAPPTTLPPTTVARTRTTRAARTEVRRIPLATNGDIFDALARCESGMRNVSSGRHLGYFQFLPSTWRSMRTGYDLPHHAPYEVQKDAARRLVARSGWGQFPVCSRKIGAVA